MFRDEAIKVMCDTVNDYNRTMVGQQGITAENMEQYIVQQMPQLEFMNGKIYDALKQVGVIN